MEKRCCTEEETVDTSTVFVVFIMKLHATCHGFGSTTGLNSHCFLKTHHNNLNNQSINRIDSWIDRLDRLVETDRQTDGQTNRGIDRWMDG